MSLHASAQTPSRSHVAPEIKMFLNHIYEFRKGIRQMVLYTMPKCHEEFAIRRLSKLGIDYTIQAVDAQKINLFFGRKECIEVIRHIVVHPLNKLTPEEDFILGSMLGYDVCQQCLRYCKKKLDFRIAI